MHQETRPAELLEREGFSLAQGGEMVELMERHDWAQSPIGQRDQWPAALRNAIQLMLPAQAQIVLFWGADYIAFYNDAYSPTIGNKHPSALGRPAQEGWAELWDDLEPLLAEVHRTRGTVYAKDRRFYIERHGYGEDVYFDISYSPIPLDDGSVGGVLCIVNETTDRVRAQQRATVEQERLARMFEQAPGFMTLLAGPDHVFELTNHAYQTLIGNRDVIGKPVRDALPELEGQGFYDLLDSVFESGEPFTGQAVEVELIQANGGIETRLLDFVYQPIKDSNGRTSSIFVEGIDVTDRVRAELARLASQERTRLATEAASIGIWDYDPVHDLLTWDTRCRALFGIHDDSPVSYNASFLAGVHSDDRESTDRAVRKALNPEGPGTYDIEYRTIGRDDGIERWVAAKGAATFERGRPVRFVGTIIDISERKKAEAALAVSELARQEESRTLEILNTTSGRVAAEMDLGNLVQSVVDAGVELSKAAFGAFFYNVVDEGDESYMLYTLSGVERSAFERFPMPRATNLFAPTFRGEGTVRSDDILTDPRYGKNTPHKGMPEGHLPVRSYLAVPVISRSGAVIGGLFFGHPEPGKFDARSELALEGLSALAAVAIDNAQLFRDTQRLNETLEAEVAAKTQERDRIWQVSQDLLGVADEKGVWISINPAWTRILGWEQQEIIGKPSDWLVHPEDIEKTRKEVERLASGKTTLTFENRFRTREGNYRVLSWRAVPVEGRLYTVARDVTALREQTAALAEAEERLFQAQKMETVGQLTGGIAHDFNNLLQIVSGNLETIKRNLPDDAPRLHRAADNAMSGAKRAATLTQRLLAFARRQPLAPKPADANKLVAGMSELLHRTLGETIEIETVLAPSLWQIEVDTNQLETAILNLAVNARDAMPSGRMMIETLNVTVEAGKTGPSEAAPGDYVVIAVSDTGEGMNAETLQKAFEPFFTTKDVGRGTGLGLSMVYGFVQQSGGHVKIESQPGEGTTVRIYLPRMIGHAVEEEETPPPPAPDGSPDETILVCEDDHDVRAYSVSILRELGYRVLEAHDGQSAIRLLEQTEHVDLLFTDVILPGGMTGANIAAEAQRIRPGIKVLYTTGYARDAIVHHGRLDAGVAMIPKPFSYNELALRIRETLDA